MQQASVSNLHSVPAAARRRRAKTACPVCQTSDRIDKVSNVVRSGRGRLVWDNGEVAHYESELSELLDAPPPPRIAPVYRAVLELVPPLVVLAAILGAIAVLRSQDYVVIPGDSAHVATRIAVGWFGLLIPAVAVFRYVRRRISVNRELPVWRQARRKWTGLYYCPRDDIVFIGDSLEVATPARVKSLLYPRVVSQPHRSFARVSTQPAAQPSLNGDRA